MITLALALAVPSVFVVVGAESEASTGPYLTFAGKPPSNLAQSIVK